MKLSYDIFDALLQDKMSDMVFGGDVTKHIFNHYSDKVLDNNLLNVIQTQWVEEENVIQAQWVEEGLANITGVNDKEEIIKLLISDGSIQSRDDIEMDTLFISEENPGRVAYKRRR